MPSAGYTLGKCSPRRDQRAWNLRQLGIPERRPYGPELLSDAESYEVYEVYMVPAEIVLIRFPATN